MWMRFEPALRLLALAALSLAAASACVTAQKKRSSAIAKAGLEDRFTSKNPAAMAKLGVVDYGPLVWADNKRTTDIEKVLGEGRFLWMETEHFKIGSSFGFASAPKDSKARRLLKSELKQLHKKCSKIPASASKLDPWLRMHLYAHRAEELYDEFADLAGRPEGEQRLGEKQKLLLLLFDKRSDLARYFTSFCGRETQQSQRHTHYGTGHQALVMTAEGDDGPRDSETVHAQFRHHVMQLFLSAAGGGPLWLQYGLAHVYERMVPCNMINCGVRADENVDRTKLYEWEEKIRKRVKHEALVIPFEKLTRQVDLGYYGHLQAWARVEWMLQDRARFARFLQQVLGTPSRSKQISALMKTYELKPAEFDDAWRKWCQKHYK
jgi:hypothetical protein